MTNFFNDLLSDTATLSRNIGSSFITFTLLDGATVNTGKVKSPSPLMVMLAVDTFPTTSSTVTSNGKLELSVQSSAGV